MNTLTLDENLSSRLRDVAEPVEMRDPTGVVLGHFTPTAERHQAALHEKYKHLFDLEEAERVLATQRGQGRPLAEILEGLRASEKQG